MSLKMEMDASGTSRAPISVLSAAEVKTTLKPEPDKPRCSSTPCSPIKSTVSGYQILHMNSNYLVGFTTGEELLKLAQKWSSPDNSNTEALPSPIKKPVDVSLHRASRICKAKSRYYQPYDIPAINGRRRRRMPSSGDGCLKSLVSGEPGKALHGPLPLCLLKGKRVHSKSLDYLNLDKMSLREPADTEVLQYQLQHLNLRGERVFTRNKTWVLRCPALQRSPARLQRRALIFTTLSHYAIHRPLIFFVNQRCDETPRGPVRGKFKGIVHPKRLILSLCTHPHALSHCYFFVSMEQKKLILYKNSWWWPRLSHPYGSCAIFKVC